MEKIDKKPILEPFEEFQKHCIILQKLVNDLPVHPHATFPDIPDYWYMQVVLKNKFDFNLGFNLLEKALLKILVRRAIYAFRWSVEYKFLLSFYELSSRPFEFDLKRGIEYLEYFDTLVEVAKKYKVLTGELVYIADKFNKEFKELRKNFEEWKQNNLNTK